LKGAGKTPFSRGFDGRAVLRQLIRHPDILLLALVSTRSSVREYLVSEAMHHLGVPTTRALSLVVSRQEKLPRAWYPKAGRSSYQNAPPSTLVEEQAAITCRAARSFIRVGQIELFYRRSIRALNHSR